MLVAMRLFFLGACASLLMGCEATQLYLPHECRHQRLGKPRDDRRLADNWLSPQFRDDCTQKCAHRRRPRGEVLSLLEKGLGCTLA